MATPPRSTAATTPSSSSKVWAFSSRPLSQASAAAFPLSAATALTSGRKSAVARRDADLALVGRPGEIHDRLRQLAGLDHRRVVGKHVFARQHADPVAFGRVVLRRNLGQRFCVDRREQALFREKLQLRRILGEINVRRRRRAFLGDLIGDFRSLSGFDLHRNAAAFLEVGDEQIDRLLVLTAVKRQRRGVLRPQGRGASSQTRQESPARRRRQVCRDEGPATPIQTLSALSTILSLPQPPAGRGLLSIVRYQARVEGTITRGLD